MKLRVTGDLVFVRPVEKPKVSTGGIELVYDNPGHVDRGTVVAVGAGPVTAKGVRLPHLVKPGDLVLFSPDAGQEVIFERETLLSLPETDILAVVEP